MLNELIQKLDTLPSSVQVESEKTIVLAKLALHQAYVKFRTDIFLSSITESGRFWPHEDSIRLTLRSNRDPLGTYFERWESTFSWSQKCNGNIVNGSNLLPASFTTRTHRRQSHICQGSLAVSSYFATFSSFFGKSKL